MKHKKLPEFKSPDYKGTDAEFEDILLYALTNRVPANPSTVLRVGLAARVEESRDEETGEMVVDRIFVQVKKEIPGMRKVLAELKLGNTTDEFSLFDWTVQAIGERDAGKVKSCAWCTFNSSVMDTDLESLCRGRLRK